MLVFGQMLMLSFVFAVAHSFAASQIYTYRDDSGTPNFTTELDSIPEKYRSRVVPLDSDTSSPVEAASAKPSSGGRPGRHRERRVPYGRSRHPSRRRPIGH